MSLTVEELIVALQKVENKKLKLATVIGRQEPKIQALLDAVTELNNYVPTEAPHLSEYSAVTGYPFEECEDEDGEDEGIPLFSETHLYTVYGKEEARSILYRWRQVLVALEEFTGTKLQNHY